MGRAIMLQTLETTLDEFPSAIRLDMPPIIDVVSVEYTAADGVATALSSAATRWTPPASPAGWCPPTG
jgi:hypothetical protein